MSDDPTASRATTITCKCGKPHQGMPGIQLKCTCGNVVTLPVSSATTKSQEGSRGSWLGTLFILAWAIAIVPMIWRFFFPEQRGFSIGQVVLAALAAPLVYGLGSAIQGCLAAGSRKADERQDGMV